MATSEAFIRNEHDIGANLDARCVSSVCALLGFISITIMQSTNHQLLSLPSMSLCSVNKTVKRKWSLEALIYLKKTRQE